MPCCGFIYLMIYCFCPLKTFQYLVKRLQFIHTTEKGALFCFSTQVEKMILWLLQQIGCDCIYVKKHRRKIK